MSEMPPPPARRSDEDDVDFLRVVVARPNNTGIDRYDVVFLSGRKKHQVMASTLQKILSGEFSYPNVFDPETGRGGRAFDAALRALDSGNLEKVDLQYQIDTRESSNKYMARIYNGFVEITYPGATRIITLAEGLGTKVWKSDPRFLTCCVCCYYNPEQKWVAEIYARYEGVEGMRGLTAYQYARVYDLEKGVEIGTPELSKLPGSPSREIEERQETHESLLFKEWPGSQRMDGQCIVSRFDIADLSLQPRIARIIGVFNSGAVSPGQGLEP